MSKIMNAEDFCRSFEALKKVYDDIKMKDKQIKELESRPIPEDRTAEVTAYENTLTSMFDGIKSKANAENPFLLVLPMHVEVNMFYSYEGKVYVAVKSGIVEDVTEEYFESWEVEE